MKMNSRMKQKQKKMWNLQITQIDCFSYFMIKPIIKPNLNEKLNEEIEIKNERLELKPQRLYLQTNWMIFYIETLKYQKLKK